jgi:hypothetical protein
MAQLLISAFTILIVTCISVTWITCTDIFIDPLKPLFYHNLHIAKCIASQQTAYLQTCLRKTLARAVMYLFCIKMVLSSNLGRNSSYTDLMIFVMFLRRFRSILGLYLDISHSGFPTSVPYKILQNSSCIFMSAASTLKRKSRRTKLTSDTLINYCYLSIISRHVNCVLLIL